MLAINNLPKRYQSGVQYSTLAYKFSSASMLHEYGLELKPLKNFTYIQICMDLQPFQVDNHIGSLLFCHDR